MGEKELCHDCSVRLPLIICDPREGANAIRGTSTEALVEAIDLLQTFLEAIGTVICAPLLEKVGR